MLALHSYGLQRFAAILLIVGHFTPSFSLGKCTIFSQFASVKTRSAELVYGRAATLSHRAYQAAMKSMWEGKPLTDEEREAFRQEGSLAAVEALGQFSTLRKSWETVSAALARSKIQGPVKDQPRIVRIATGIGTPIIAILGLDVFLRNPVKESVLSRLSAHAIAPEDVLLTKPKSSVDAVLNTLPLRKGPIVDETKFVQKYQLAPEIDRLHEEAMLDGHRTLFRIADLSRRAWKTLVRTSILAVLGLKAVGAQNISIEDSLGNGDLGLDDHAVELILYPDSLDEVTILVDGQAYHFDLSATGVSTIKSFHINKLSSLDSLRDLLRTKGDHIRIALFVSDEEKQTLVGQLEGDLRKGFLPIPPLNSMSSEASRYLRRIDAGPLPLIHRSKAAIVASYKLKKWLGDARVGHIYSASAHSSLIPSVTETLETVWFLGQSPVKFGLYGLWDAVNPKIAHSPAWYGETDATRQAHQRLSEALKKGSVITIEEFLTLSDSPTQGNELSGLIELLARNESISIDQLRNQVAISYAAQRNDQGDLVLEVLKLKRKGLPTRAAEASR